MGWKATLEEKALLSKQGFTLDETAYITGISRERLNDCIRAGLLMPVYVGISDQPKAILDLEQIKQFLADMRGEKIGGRKDLETARANIEARDAYCGKNRRR